ncbi:NAD(P)/FAD-dependent oxidoreductase [Roseicyclus marinus]|uniref:NAD(P)/FAD-dependent oxidoreductase n=1 Tax=Roseicyclus marinus TaxID=2161673 RepID=UPI00240F4C09|nr:FAD-binding oxidoreductase [Roseicyclus marinus]MDG3040801.1 FAD-binding oxidoreductase [Roseicyclus marinus]
MNPLYRNDRRGEHAPSWYAASLPPEPDRPALTGAVSADVVILGAGFTGLWAALTLARAGRRVVVLEAHRVGFGASGRNGGQVQSGFNKSQRWLETHLGNGPARALWSLSETGKDQLRQFCETHAPEAAYRPGVAHGEYSALDLAEARLEADHMARHYDTTIEVMGRDAFADLVKSPLYVGGTLDRSAGHIQPLAYARALARAAEAAGAVIHELSEVTAIVTRPRLTLTTPRGQVTAGHAIIAGNGYLPNILPQVNARVMPINSFIAATDPIPDRWHDVLAEDIAVSDARFVVNYYRFSADRRFLFGGRESYSLGFPRDISTALVARMEKLFPQLAGVGISHVWGGSLGITMTRLPHVVRAAPNILSGAGFSGHGVALSGMAGRVMAEAVMGQENGLTTLAALPVPRFPGGTSLRAPLLTLAMTWYALRDRLGV